MTTVAAGEWALFLDWAASRDDIDLLSADEETLQRFFTDCPAAASTRRRRATRIRSELRRQGIFDADDPSAPLLRVGEGWVSVQRALAQLPTLRFPAGLRGRRDGWLIVLIGVLGMTRREAARVRPAELVFGADGVAVRGQLVPAGADAAGCPRCAVHRWAAVVGPASLPGHRAEAMAMLSAVGADVEAHACHIEPEGSWRQVATLLPSIDRYGWVGTSPLTPLSISNIMAARQRPSGYVEHAAAPARAPGRFADATAAELAEAYDDVDARLAELLARTAEVLGRGQELAGDLRDFGVA